MCACVTGTRGCQKKESDLLEPVMNGCESLGGCWELDPCLLQEQ